MSIVRIDPEGRRNAEHIAIIIVGTSSPSKAIFAQDGHRPSNHCIKTATRRISSARTDPLARVGSDGYVLAAQGRPDATAPRLAE